MVATSYPLSQISGWISGKKRKERRWGKHYRHGLGKDVFFFSAPLTDCRDTNCCTSISSGEINIGSFSTEINGGWEAEACTPPGVLLGYLWGLCSMSRIFICMSFVEGLIAGWMYLMFYRAGEREVS
jgi:hypothetical protein